MFFAVIGNSLCFSWSQGQIKYSVIRFGQLDVKAAGWCSRDWSMFFAMQRHVIQRHWCLFNHFRVTMKLHAQHLALDCWSLHDIWTKNIKYPQTLSLDSSRDEDRGAQRRATFQRWHDLKNENQSANGQPSQSDIRANEEVHQYPAGWINQHFPLN